MDKHNIIGRPIKNSVNAFNSESSDCGINVNVRSYNITHGPPHIDKTIVTTESSPMTSLSLQEFCTFEGSMLPFLEISCDGSTNSQSSVSSEKECAANLEQLDNRSLPNKRKITNKTSPHKRKPSMKRFHPSKWNSDSSGDDVSSLPSFQESCNYEESMSKRKYPTRNAPPISYFYIFCNSSILNDIAIFTNKYAKIHLQANDNQFSSLKKFKCISYKEVLGFMAVILNMGIRKQPTLTSYWSTNTSQFTPWFSKMFSQSRFEEILFYFHTLDPSKVPNNKSSTFNQYSRMTGIMEKFSQYRTITSFKRHKKRKMNQDPFLKKQLVDSEEPNSEETNANGTELSYKCDTSNPRGLLRITKNSLVEILDNMMGQAYSIYRNNSDRPLTRFKFQVSIIENISRDWLQIHT